MHVCARKVTVDLIESFMAVAPVKSALGTWKETK
jgi:hypothetical protein